MRKTLTLLLATPLSWAAADAPTGGSASPVVAEIVTFKLIDNTQDADFINAANAMTSLLQQTGDVVSRTLSRDADGVWTDYIIWTSMEAAKAAAQSLPNSPDAAPFMSAINPDSVTMRHAHVLFTMEQHASN